MVNMHAHCMQKSSKAGLPHSLVSDLNARCDWLKTLLQPRQATGSSLTKTIVGRPDQLAFKGAVIDLSDTVKPCEVCAVVHIRGILGMEPALRFLPDSTCVPYV